MLPYQNDNDRLYALSRVPLSKVSWGTKESTSLRLCLRGDNVPITVWIFGHVSSLWFFNPMDGEPNAKVSIGVTPLTQHAKSMAKAILEQLAMPKDCESKRVLPFPLYFPFSRFSHPSFALSPCHAFFLFILFFVLCIFLRGSFTS